ncbi:MAG: LacI family DNA-binding transcriptional regulator [Nibricoccus sp.]
MTPKKNLITITDVARTAGVAVGTVSRVLNNHPDVNAAIRAKVWDVAQKLNYTRIRRRHTRAIEPIYASNSGTIAAIFFGMEDTLVQLPVVSAALQGIEAALSSQGRNLMIANIPKADRIPPFFRENNVAGLILKGPNQGELPSPEENELLQNIYRYPHVWLMGRLNNAKGDHANFDTEIAGRLAAEHFLQKGHRRLAFLNPKPGQTQFEKLRNGYFAASVRVGIRPTLFEAPSRESFEWPLPAITSEDAVDKLVDQWSHLPEAQRPTAMFVPADRTAVQLYSALQARGLRVGKDLSVISCNNERSLTTNLQPVVTTIDVHAEHVGRRAVDQLLWRIRHPDDPLNVQVLTEPSLVEGQSVASLG